MTEIHFLRNEVLELQKELTKEILQKDKSMKECKLMMQKMKDDFTFSNNEQEKKIQMMTTINEKYGERLEVVHNQLEAMNKEHMSCEKELGRVLSEGEAYLLQKLNVAAIEKKEEELNEYKEYANSLEEVVANELLRSVMQGRANDMEGLFQGAFEALGELSSAEFVLSVMPLQSEISTCCCPSECSGE